MDEASHGMEDNVAIVSWAIGAPILVVIAYNIVQAVLGHSAIELTSMLAEIVVAGRLTIILLGSLGNLKSAISVNEWGMSLDIRHLLDNEIRFMSIVYAVSVVAAIIALLSGGRLAVTILQAILPSPVETLIYIILLIIDVVLHVLYEW